MHSYEKFKNSLARIYASFNLVLTKRSYIKMQSFNIKCVERHVYRVRLAARHVSTIFQIVKDLYFSDNNFVWNHHRKCRETTEHGS